jgi:predicted amidohydrolase
MLRVGYFQLDVAAGDKKLNLAKVSDAAEGLRADLLVLPELFNTGYLFVNKEELVGVAEPVPGGQTTEALLDIARRACCCIVGGVAELDGADVYNTAVVVDKGGYIGKYRKIHLSKYEKRWFAHGRENKVFQWNGLKLGVQVCFDLWFPELSRELLLQGADILCACANFGGPETPQIARVRALENMTHLVLCNRVGAERGEAIDADFVGRSAVIGPRGEILAGDRERTEESGAAEIDIAPTRIRQSAVCGDLLAEIALYGARGSADR